MAEETLDPKEMSEAQPETPAPPAAEEAQPETKAPAEPPEEAQDAEGPAGEAEPEDQKEPTPDFDIQVEDAGTLRKKVTVTVTEAMIDAKREEMFGELNTSAQVPGFRIGRAPRRLLVKRFGKEVDRDVRNALIGESLGAGLEKSGLTVLGEPDIDLDAIELPDSGDMTYQVEVEVAPEFELPELDGIKITKPVVAVTDDRIDEAIERMRLSEARYEPSDEPAAEQDMVVAQAKVGGEGIDETETVVTLRVAPGQIEGLPLVDLGKELAGKKAGESVTMTAKVPAVHPNEAWQGKEARIELTIQEVRKRRLPEVNDAYAERAGYESLAELRERFAERMKAQVELEADRAMREQINEYLLSHTEFDLPEGVASRHAARVLQRRHVDLLQMGVSREQVDERMTEIEASVNEQANRDLKLTFLFQKIAEKQGIEVTEEEVNSRVARMAAMYRRRPERLRQELESDGTISQVEVSIREEKATRALLAKANVIEETDEPGAETADKEKADEQEAEPGTPDEGQARRPAPAEQTGPAEEPDEETDRPSGEAQEEETKP